MTQTRTRQEKERPFRLLSEEAIECYSSVPDFSSVAAIMLDFLIIAICMVCVSLFNHVWVWLICIPLVGGRMMGLWAMLHEATHRSLFSNQRLNDLAARVLLAWPLFLSYNKFRSVHLQHHRHFRSEKDPENHLQQFEEFQFPMSAFRLASIFLADLSGLNFLRYRAATLIRHVTNRDSDSIKLASLLCAMLLLLCLIGLSVLGWFAIIPASIKLWLISYATWFPAIYRLRLMADHMHLPEDDPLQTRTIEPNWFEKLFVMPRYANYHIEHHLYPSLSGKYLSSVRDQLQKGQSAQFDQPGTSYLRFLGELIG